MLNANDLDPDFKVHDGYVAFSAEVVRLALLSPAAFALFIALAGKDSTSEAFAKLIGPGRGQLVVSFVFMGLAVFFGLLHRYCASKFMATLVAKRRSGGSMRGEWSTWASTMSIFGAPASLFVGAAFLFTAV